jgi:hypothetical protein
VRSASEGIVYFLCFISVVDVFILAGLFPFSGFYLASIPVIDMTVAMVKAHSVGNGTAPIMAILMQDGAGRPVVNFDTTRINCQSSFPWVHSLHWI